ncbi:MAG: hypothetical protein NC078_11235 [Ruminococcus sp.]|nr:hypothetical protein [Ruminococcus sp.]
MKGTKKAAAIALTMTVTALLSGCGSVQVNERMYVQMMGLAEEEGECVLCVQVCGTEGKPGEPPVYEYHEGRGENFGQAAAAMERENGRELFFGHCTLAALDSKYLYNAEGIKTLLGERVSPGCRAVWAEEPRELLSEETDSGIVGADVISGQTERLEKRGQFSEVTLRDVCVWADKSAPMLLPAFSEGDFGSGAAKNNAANSNENFLFLSAEETALCNMLKEETGAEFSILGGTARVDNAKKFLYLQTGENIMNISLALECTLTELGDSGSIADYEQAAGNAVTARLSELLKKTDEEGATEAVTGTAAEKGTAFNVNVNVKIKDKDKN